MDPSSGLTCGASTFWRLQARKFLVARTDSCYLHFLEVAGVSILDGMFFFVGILGPPSWWTARGCRARQTRDDRENSFGILLGLTLGRPRDRESPFS